MPTTTGHGAALTFQSGLVAEAKDFQWGGMSRTSIETTNMATTTHRTFIPHTLSDRGELTVEANLDDQVEAWCDAIDQAAETVTLAFPSGTTWAASGFLRDASFHSPMDDVQTATLVIKYTGDITVA